MARITIVGSGIIGMAVAATLSRTHEVTIVARNLPGDDPSIDWASPWAGASFIFGGTSDLVEMKMQLDAFAELSRWCDLYPESTLKRITLDDVFDDDRTEEDIWWRKTVVDPLIFLPWLKKKLEGQGVRFERMDLKALSDARALGHDVLINATGFGSKFLTDVNDSHVLMVRGQTMLIKTDYLKYFMHDNGVSYTYVIPHLNGTAIVGGCRQPDDMSPEVNNEICQDIVRRIHQNLPDQFSPNLCDYQILRHNVGLRPCRTTGIRLEKEVLDGQRVVHVYGCAGGGYIHSFGAARIARDLVDEFLFPEVEIGAKL